MKQAYLFLFAFLAIAWLHPATAAPRSLADCEKLREDDAYNKCLASFGPRRNAPRNTGKVYPGNAYEPPRRGARSTGARARPRGVRGMQIYRTKGGRVRSVIPVPVRRKR